MASAGAYYVFAGGRAFGIPTPAKLAAVRKTDKARPLQGPVGPAQTSPVLASGELLSTSGRVFVSYQGDLYPFKSLAQLRADGYGGTAALTAPSTGGVPSCPPTAVPDLFSPPSAARAACQPHDRPVQALVNRRPLCFCLEECDTLGFAASHQQACSGASWLNTAPRSTTVLRTWANVRGGRAPGRAQTVHGTSSTAASGGQMFTLPRREN